LALSTHSEPCLEHRPLPTVHCPKGLFTVHYPPFTAHCPLPIAGLGVSLGLAALLRQSILPWAAALALFLAWRGWRARRARQTALALLGVAAIVAAFIVPFTLRNYLVYRQFLLLNSNAGYAMYSAQHPMHGINFREFDAAPVPPGVLGKSEPEMDRELMRLGIQFVLADPVRYVLLSLSRLRAYFEFWPAPGTTLLHNIGRVASFGLFLPFMLYGLYRVACKQGQTPLARDLAIVFLFMAFYTVQAVLTWAMVRYRLPVDAVLIVFAAYGLRDLYLYLYRPSLSQLRTQNSKLSTQNSKLSPARPTVYHPRSLE
jgi:hypothetical protein